MSQLSLEKVVYLLLFILITMSVEVGVCCVY